MFRRPAWLCLRFAPCVVTEETPHFGGCAPQWRAMTPKFELGRDFCMMHLPQVSSSYVYSFRSYCVHKHTHKQTKPTHKQTDSGENTQHSLLRYDVGQTSSDAAVRWGNRNKRLWPVSWELSAESVTTDSVSVWSCFCPDTSCPAVQVCLCSQWPAYNERHFAKYM